jgi:hypothetical protein
VINDSYIAELAGIVARGMAESRVVEIDGLGVFYPQGARGFRFEAASDPQVFIAYVKEDDAAAERLYSGLEAAGFRPWMDVRKLVAGQNWPRAIEGAIEASDFFVACFSENSVDKKGGFQAEIRYALDCARRVPLEDIFIVPVRLDACRVPRSIQREFQYIDLFHGWERGVMELAAMMRREVARKQGLRP